MGRPSVLIVEDEPDIQEVMAFNLEREGFRVDCVADGNAALDRAREKSPDLILLDLMLPGMDGVEVCRSLRQDPLLSGIPVIMVTARDAESDVVLGLGIGADDYLTKPFRVRELIARVKAVMRRGGLKVDGRTRIVRDGVAIDPDRFEVRVDGSSVSFTATEFRLLHLLACHPGRVFTRDHLISRAIGEDAVVIDRNIDVHVRAIRKKLRGYRTLIETVRGVGYRFRAEDN